MILAARRLKGLALVLFVLLFVMALYPLSLRVAATRAELKRVEREIALTQRQIRDLESEVAVRASMAQLEAWNTENFGYVPPTAAQYLDGERALASLDRLPVSVPGPAPVLVAMAEAAADADGDGGAEDADAPLVASQARGGATPLARAQLATLSRQLTPAPQAASAPKAPADPDAPVARARLTGGDD